jgi:hypothetical protein
MHAIVVLSMPLVCYFQVKWAHCDELKTLVFFHLCTTYIMFKGFVLSTLVNVLIPGFSLFTIAFIKVHLYAIFSFDWTPFTFLSSTFNPSTSSC